MGNWRRFKPMTVDELLLGFSIGNVCTIVISDEGRACAEVWTSYDDKEITPVEQVLARLAQRLINDNSRRR
jgi:hypothetical protein